MNIDLNDRPRRKKPGLIDMKYAAITFGTRFKDSDPRYMERIAEICNLSNGQRTVAEIARIVRYEVGPVSDELVQEICQALAQKGFLLVQEGNGN